MSNTLNYVLSRPNDAADEIDRLREALESIDRLATRHVKGAIGMAQRIARAALSNGERG